MNIGQRFYKTQEREFFAHHLLLRATAREIEEAQTNAVGRFNKCLAAIVLSSLAIEALLNAAGSRIVSDWEEFERLSPLEKVSRLAENLSLHYDPNKEPWSAITQFADFRNQIAHPKPELILEKRNLPEVALEKMRFNRPKSQIERQITLGNAQRVHKAVCELKIILHDSLPEDERFGIYADMWSGSTRSAE